MKKSLLVRLVQHAEEAEDRRAARRGALAALEDDRARIEAEKACLEGGFRKRLEEWRAQAGRPTRPYVRIEDRRTAWEGTILGGAAVLVATWRGAAIAASSGGHAADGVIRVLALAVLVLIGVTFAFSDPERPRLGAQRIRWLLLPALGVMGAAELVVVLGHFVPGVVDSSAGGWWGWRGSSTLALTVVGAGFVALADKFHWSCQDAAAYRRLEEETCDNRAYQAQFERMRDALDKEVVP